MLPLLACICSVYCPAGVPAAVLTVSFDEPDVFTVAGENDAVAPAGSPVIAKLTTPEKPPVAVIEAVYVVEVFFAIWRDFGETSSTKSDTACAVTMYVNDVECVVPSVAVPVTVSG
jgi:hypothetical protein